MFFNGYNRKKSFSFLLQVGTLLKNEIINKFIGVPFLNKREYLV